MRFDTNKKNTAKKRFNLGEFKLLLSLSLQALETNRLRTILTTIGIIIGIATIIIVLSAGRGLEKYIIDQVEAFGADTIEVEMKIPNVSDMEMMSAMMRGAEITTLKVEDFEALKELPNIGNYYAGILGQFKTVYRNNSKTAMIYATTAGLTEIDKQIKIGQGRFFNEKEEKSQAKIAVLGYDLKEELFGAENAIGKSIKINQVNFKVIGVTEKRGGIFYFNYDKMIFVPLKTAQKQLLGVDHVIYGFLQVKDLSKTSETVADITSIMRKRHSLPPDNPDKDDFRVTSMQEALEMMGVVTFGITLLVLAVAGISLVVGGVGIMNIMYLTVLERTREIGLRKALGAKNKIIERQFLLETIIITGLGGVAGIIFGSIVVVLIEWVSGSLGYSFGLTITLDAVLLAISAALLFGIAFGLYPARKASHLSPVEALRYE
ncbi:ABC transporter permease [Candidatus Peregrinibacteria bacterium]|nr:ABC transporter permease [Candidatus Peregrinibacteria bacterium]